MAVPSYLRIRSDLERRIRSGALPPGTRLPTEAELQREHSVSRTTAQRVLHELAQAGLVERRRRRGTFVSSTAKRENLLRLVDPTHGAEVPGRHIVHSVKIVAAHEAAIDLPDTQNTTPVHELSRIKLDSDEEPVAVELTAVPFAIAPHLAEEDLAQLTVHDHFARNGVPAATSRVHIDPILLDTTNAELLGTVPEQPVLRLRRHTWLTDGVLAETMWHLIRPDRVEFFIEQSVLGPNVR